MFLGGDRRRQKARQWGEGETNGGVGGWVGSEVFEVKRKRCGFAWSVLGHPAPSVINDIRNKRQKRGETYGVK